LNRTTQTIKIKSIDQIPSIDSIRTLPRGKKLQLRFLGFKNQERERIGQRLSKVLQDFQVSIHTIEPEINITKLITDREIEDLQLFFEKCAQDYKLLGEKLIHQLANKLGTTLDKDSPLHCFQKFKNRESQRGEMDDWSYFLHGIHCGFENKNTGQQIEVCLIFGNEFGDLDPYFFSRFINSTPAYQPLPVEIYEDYAEGHRIIEKMLALGRFEKIKPDEEYHPGIVVSRKA
jgi:hypothetical protein